MIERKTKQDMNKNGILNARKPYTNDVNGLNSVKFDNTDTHMEMRMRDNGMSDHGKNRRCNQIARHEKG